MAPPSLPSRPRIIGQTAHKYLSKPVTVVGEVISIVPNANTITLRLPDDENMIVLLQNNTATIELNQLTEVTGKLVSRAQIEATDITQWPPKALALFNKALYIQAVTIYEAHQEHYEI